MFVSRAPPLLHFSLKTFLTDQRSCAMFDTFSVAFGGSGQHVSLFLVGFMSLITKHLPVSVALCFNVPELSEIIIQTIPSPQHRQNKSTILTTCTMEA